MSYSTCVQIEYKNMATEPWSQPVRGVGQPYVNCDISLCQACPIIVRVGIHVHILYGIGSTGFVAYPIMHKRANDGFDVAT